jgi:all-trans-retinol dehydrogenase (NAD+)
VRKFRLNLYGLKVTQHHYLIFSASVDVTNREKVLETGAKVLKEVGTVNTLLNNAGIMPQHEFLKHTENEIRKIFEINVLAHFWMFQAFLPKMVEINKGHIVALSSMAGLMGMRNLVPYCGSKYAVRGIQEAMSEELRATSNGNSKVSRCLSLKFPIISFYLPPV